MTATTDETTTSTTVIRDESSLSSDQTTSSAFMLFKRKLQQHKRQPQNPNRLDDILVCHEDVIDTAAAGKQAFESTTTATTTNGPDDSSSSCKANNSLLYPIPIHDNDDENDSNPNHHNNNIYGIHGFDGCLLMPGAIPPHLQRTLAYQAVTEYCRCPPHATNLVQVGRSSCDSDNSSNEPFDMWETWKLRQHQQEAAVKHRAKAKPCHKKPKTTTATTAASIGNNTNTTNGKIQKLAWATMGYHYNWTERSYNQQDRSDMPPLVGQLATKYATLAMHIHQQQQQQWDDDDVNTPPSTVAITTTEKEKEEKHRHVHRFTPSAAIVNYYTTKSTMGGHVDDLEYTFDKPIVSISLGLPAVFILGRSTAAAAKDEENGVNVNDTAPLPAAIAIVLRPGDVLTMHGPSRLALHAMARVIPYEAAQALPSLAVLPSSPIGITTPPPSSILSTTTTLANATSPEDPRDNDNNAPDDNDDNDDPIPAEEAAFLESYLQHHRININVRQVYPDDGEDDDDGLLHLRRSNSSMGLEYSG